MNPLAAVRATCSEVVRLSVHVTIVDSAIEEHASKFGDSVVGDFGKEVEWDAQGWHYCADVGAIGPLTVQFIFVMDALNFCFWPSPRFEYDTLAVSLKNVLEKDPSAFNADKLACITEETLASWFPEDNMIPAIPERVCRLREVGAVLASEFDGLAANMVAAADHSAVAMVKLVLQHFPGFRDCTTYRGSEVHLYKRAQILVGDVWAAYGRSTDPAHKYSFHDLQEITMFADYRVPQILRHMGVMRYSPELAERIDSLGEIPKDSEEEVEIRAATVIAVERLQKSLEKHGRSLLSLEVDWLLWQW
eukprot:CAMPEP_0173190590 /NCGR_PEP_ID=MMETSP1141-20130122/12427_1 /TAXON_ID=483371 /ORGANISM="non described non described, Strain CCMP2298" /LENGTH=304 /DNA_ID=CAMNT_0014114711 /DNA_START=11 /DNA_END=922 /DNA_ORIENTATION=-